MSHQKLKQNIVLYLITLFFSKTSNKIAKIMPIGIEIIHCEGVVWFDRRRESKDDSQTIMTIIKYRNIRKSRKKSRPK